MLRESETKKREKVVAHREGRTRSLQISRAHVTATRKSLTLYPIELGGRYRLSFISLQNQIPLLQSVDFVLALLAQAMVLVYGLGRARASYGN